MAKVAPSCSEVRGPRGQTFESRQREVSSPSPPLYLTSPHIVASIPTLTLRAERRKRSIHLEVKRTLIVLNSDRPPRSSWLETLGPLVDCAVRSGPADRERVESLPLAVVRCIRQKEVIAESGPTFRCTHCPFFAQGYMPLEALWGVGYGLWSSVRDEQSG